MAFLKNSAESLRMRSPGQLWPGPSTRLAAINSFSPSIFFGIDIFQFDKFIIKMDKILISAN